MQEPYDIDVAPNGKIFVSQCGWGRRFDSMESALSYIDTMTRKSHEEVTDNALGIFDGACVVPTG